MSDKMRLWKTVCRKAIALGLLAVASVHGGVATVGAQPPNEVAPVEIPQGGVYSTAEALTGAPALLPENTISNSADVMPIDLPSALRLAGSQNPVLAIAYQRTLQATALQQFAAAQLLPNLNFGTNYDGHTGDLMQANGNVINVSREALYVGAGANAVAAGSVSIPGVQYNLNASETIFRILAARPALAVTQFAARAAGNNLQLEVAIAYGDLLRSEGSLAIARQIREQATEIARLTGNYASTGQGRAADAERAANELARRENDVVQAEAAVSIASARLVALLNLDVAVRLHAAEPWVVPRSVVPDPIPLPELLAIALYRRPELAQYRAAVNTAMVNLQGQRALLFSPQVIMGFSSGSFGGGSNIVASSLAPTFNAPADQTRFGNFNTRDDYDIIMYWSIRNLGFGNRALVDTARARLGAAQMERLIVFNQVQAEVALAYANKQSLLAQINMRQRAVEVSQSALRADLLRTRNNEGRPIEVLDSLRLLADARLKYLQSIVSYNQAHFALYNAVGQPPADLLVRPATSELVLPAVNPQ